MIFCTVGSEIKKRKISDSETIPNTLLSLTTTKRCTWERKVNWKEEKVYIYI